MPGYKKDLAYIHDVGFGDFAKNSAPGLLEIMRRAEINDGLVVDLGCGSGIWARELVDAGYDVLGIDYSTSMIEIAKKRVRKGSFRVASCLRARLPRCRTVTALGEVLNYMSDRRNNIRAVGQLFGRVHDALEPGGVFVFDVAEPGRCRGRPPGYWEGADWACCALFETDERASRLTRRIVCFRKVGKLYRRSEEVHVLQLYRRQEIAKMLRKRGFRVRVIRSYGESQLLESIAGFVARKPA